MHLIALMPDKGAKTSNGKVASALDVLSGAPAPPKFIFSVPVPPPEVVVPPPVVVPPEVVTPPQVAAPIMPDYAASLRPEIKGKLDKLSFLWKYVSERIHVDRVLKILMGLQETQTVLNDCDGYLTHQIATIPAMFKPDKLCFFSRKTMVAIEYMQNMDPEALCGNHDIWMMLWKFYRDGIVDGAVEEFTGQYSDYFDFIVKTGSISLLSYFKTRLDPQKKYNEVKYFSSFEEECISKRNVNRIYGLSTAEFEEKFDCFVWMKTHGSVVVADRENPHVTAVMKTNKPSNIRWEDKDNVFQAIATTHGNDTRVFSDDWFKSVHDALYSAIGPVDEVSVQRLYDALYDFTQANKFEHPLSAIYSEAELKILQYANGLYCVDDVRKDNILKHIYAKTTGDVGGLYKKAFFGSDIRACRRLGYPWCVKTKEDVFEAVGCWKLVPVTQIPVVKYVDPIDSLVNVFYNGFGVDEEAYLSFYLIDGYKQKFGITFVDWGGNNIDDYLKAQGYREIRSKTERWDL